MTEDQRALLDDLIDEMGLEEAILDFSDWKSIEDEEFHELRSTMLEARTNMQTYVR